MKLLEKGVRVIGERLSTGLEKGDLHYCENGIPARTIKKRLSQRKIIKKQFLIKITLGKEIAVCWEEASGAVKTRKKKKTLTGKLNKSVKLTVKSFFVTSLFLALWLINRSCLKGI